jgi:hypothetical protein
MTTIERRAARALRGSLEGRIAEGRERISGTGGRPARAIGNVSRYKNPLPGNWSLSRNTLQIGWGRVGEFDRKRGAGQGGEIGVDVFGPGGAELIG